MTPAEGILADAYRDWFQLILDEAAGVRHPTAECAEILALVHVAAAGVPDPDAVFHATAAEWERVMRVDPLTGKPRKPTPAPSPQGTLL